MPFAFTQDVPIDAELYQRIRDGLGPDLPPGLIIHMAVELAEGGLRYYEVWESAEDCDRWSEDRLHPVVHALLADVFGEQLPDEPARTPLPIIHAWGAGSN